MFDRIEAGTFIIAGALNWKKIKNFRNSEKFFKYRIKILKKMGVKDANKQRSYIFFIHQNKTSKNKNRTLPWVFQLIYKLK